MTESGSLVNPMVIFCYLSKSKSIFVSHDIQHLSSYGGVRKNRGTHSHHPFLDWIFPYKPSIWEYPQLLETPYLCVLTIVNHYQPVLTIIKHHWPSLISGFSWIFKWLPSTLAGCLEVSHPTLAAAPRPRGLAPGLLSKERVSVHRPDGCGCDFGAAHAHRPGLFLGTGT